MLIPSKLTSQKTATAYHHIYTTDTRGLGLDLGPLLHQAMHVEGHCISRILIAPQAIKFMEQTPDNFSLLKKQLLLSVDHIHTSESGCTVLFIDCSGISPIIVGSILSEQLRSVKY